MCISFNNTQSEKASTPILLTLFGIIIDVIFFFIRFGIVLRLILSTLDNEGNGYGMSAYEILIKAFNFCKPFDYGMIFYFRFYLYKLLL